MTIDDFKDFVSAHQWRFGNPALGFQNWIDIIGDKVRNQLVPALTAVNMALPLNSYEAVNGQGIFDLAEIADFNSLITFSQEHGVPPFSLGAGMIDRFGTVLNKMLVSRDRFDVVFTNLADKIIQLT